MCRSTSDNTAPDAKPAQGVPQCVPTDPISQTAYKYAAQELHLDILNHSLRVYLHAYELAVREGASWVNPDRLPFLFAACILHDLGTTATHDGPQRFEVEGADAAVTVVRSADPSVSEADLHEIWVGIALHTSPGIAERITPLARLVRLGVAIDFKRPITLTLTTQEAIDAAERSFPRGAIEKVLGDTVAEQGMRQPEKAPAASWPGILLRSAKENPDWKGVNKSF